MDFLAVPPRSEVMEGMRSRFKQQGLVSKLSAKVRRARSTTPNEVESPEPVPLTDLTTPNLNSFANVYDLGEVLGQGANAIVKKCVRRSDGEIFAVKISRLEEEHLLYTRKLFNTGMQLGSFAHRNLVKYEAMYICMAQRTCNLVT